MANESAYSTLPSIPPSIPLLLDCHQGWCMHAGSPGPIIGYSPTSFMNLLHTIAVYGTLCKALNVGAMRCAPTVLDPPN